MAVASGEEPLIMETPGALQTIDTTLNDMRTVSSRINLCIESMSTEERHDAKTSLSVGEESGNDSLPSDPIVRQMVELRKSLRSAQADIEMQKDAIARLEQQVAYRDKEIELLRGTVQELEDELAAEDEDPLGMSMSQQAMNTSFRRRSSLNATARPGQSISGGLFNFTRSGTSKGRSLVNIMGSMQVDDGEDEAGQRNTRQLSIFGAVLARRVTNFNASRRGTCAQTAVSDLDGNTTSIEERMLASTLRLLPRMGGKDNSPVGDVTFMSMRIQSMDRLIQKESQSFGKAASQFLAVADRVVNRYFGYIISGDIDHYFVAFHDPVAAAGAALDMQRELVDQDWPPQFEDDVDCCSVRDDTTNTWIWHGLRARIGIYHTENAEQQRDILTGAQHYYGHGVKMAMFMESKSTGGIIVFDDHMRDFVAESLVELQDPVTVFHEWAMVPGESEPVRLWRLISRDHAGRAPDIDAVLRREHPPRIYRMVTNEEKKPNLEEAVAAFTEAVAAGEDTEDVKPDDSAPTLEGAGKSESMFALALHSELEGWFKPQSLFTDEPVRNMPSGDQCLIVVNVPDFDAMCEFSEEANVLNYMKRFQAFVKQLKPSGSGAVDIRTVKDRMLFAFSDPVQALEFALQVQERAVTIPWPEPHELAPFVQPRYYRRKLISNGPRISVVVHCCRVKAVKNLFTHSKNFYVGGEVDIVLGLLEASCQESVAGAAGGIFLSELMYSHALFATSICKKVVFEPIGLMPSQVEGEHVEASKHASAAVPLIKMTSRALFGRLFLSAADAIAEIERSNLNTFIPLKGKLPAAAPKDARPVIWELLVEQSEVSAHGQLPAVIMPSPAALSASDTITSTSTQAMVTRSHFEKSKANLGLKRVWQNCHKDYRAVPTTCRRHLIEQLECAMMFEHDDAMPSTVPAPTITVSKRELFDMVSRFDAENQELAAATGLDTQNHPLISSQSSAALHHSPTLPNMETESDGASPTTAGRSGPATSFDDERLYFQRREQRVTDEVLQTHKVMEYFFMMLRQYLNPLLEETSDTFGDDEFIVSFVQHMRKMKSDGEGQHNAKIGDEWRGIVHEAVAIEDHGNIKYDVVKLCRSIVAHCCKHFLYARTLLRRVQRREQRGSGVSAGKEGKKEGASATKGGASRFHLAAQAALKASKEAGSETLARAQPTTGSSMRRLRPPTGALPASGLTPSSDAPLSPLLEPTCDPSQESATPSPSLTPSVSFSISPRPAAN